MPGRESRRAGSTAGDVPRAGPYGLTQLVDDAFAVIERLDLEAFVLVGHSMGGKVAQLVASQRPIALRGLVLVAPAAPRPRVDEEEARRRSHAYDTRDTVIGAIDRALTHRPLRADLREQVVADSLAGAPQAVLAWPLEGMLEDITDAVRQIDVPVQVLAGEHDLVDPPEALAVDLLPFIPSARMTIIDGTGHLSPLDVPEQIANEIDRFVAGLQPDLL